MLTLVGVSPHKHIAEQIQRLKMILTLTMMIMVKLVPPTLEPITKAVTNHHHLVKQTVPGMLLLVAQHLLLSKKMSFKTIETPTYI